MGNRRLGADENRTQEVSTIGMLYGSGHGQHTGGWKTSREKSQVMRVGWREKQDGRGW